MNGILNIYKEKGYTSHDVVARLRGILKQKKIGHTGTLDPDAEGVLPVCVGKSTKVCSLLTDKEKAYQAVLLLGISTDTQDLGGSVTAKRPVGNLSEGSVAEAVMSFTGTYGQIPPMYSALKVNGKKLYELARAGIEIERKERVVQIHSIRIEKVALPRVEMTVSCSKGTYIRTLCHDIGEKLGCGGCMESLVRIRSGNFTLEHSYKLQEVEKIYQDGLIETILMPTWEVFKDYPEVIIKDEVKLLAYNGNPFEQHHIEAAKSETRDLQQVRVCDSAGHFIGIYQYEELKKRYKPVKMFLEGVADR